MWFSLSDQTAYFLWSIVMGAVMAMLYDIVRALRMLLHPGRIFLLVSDVLFFVLCGIFTSLFALPFNKGSVRAFIVFGEALGFLSYRLTIGNIAGRFYGILSKGIMWISQKICELLKKIFDLLLKTASRVLYNVGVVKERIGKSISVRKKKRNSRTVRKADRAHGTVKKSRRDGRKKSKGKYHERRKKKKKQPQRG